MKGVFNLGSQVLIQVLIWINNSLWKPLTEAAESKKQIPDKDLKSHLRHFLDPTWILVDGKFYHCHIIFKRKKKYSQGTHR